MAPEEMENLKLVFVTRAESQDAQAVYDGKLHDTVVSLAEIKTKLNLSLGILSAIGVAVLSIALKFMFGG